MSYREAASCSRGLIRRRKIARPTRLIAFGIDHDGQRMRRVGRRGGGREKLDTRSLFAIDIAVEEGWRSSGPVS